MFEIRKPKLLKRYLRDESGASALAFALGLTVMLMGVGAGIDFSMATKTHNKAQLVADSISLSAAIYVKENDGPPTGEDASKGFAPGHTYTAKQLGFDFGTAVIGDVSITTTYDMRAGEAITTITGKTNTTFTSIMGHDEVEFRAVSVSAFFEQDLTTEVSVVIVADNSGSMAWDDTPIERRNNAWHQPENPQQRMAALRNAVSLFNQKFRDEIGTQTEGKRTLRTGLLSYNSAIIDSKSSPMAWGTLSDSVINNMSPQGGTNSSPPMSKAKKWLKDEKNVHKQETKSDDPLLYAIFLTDGVNNVSGNNVWEPKSGTEVWRRWECNGSWCYWNYYSPYATQPVSGAEEGTLKTPSEVATEDTIEACEEMKKKGMRVFTIGFALEPGWYYNRNGNPRENYYTSNYEYTSQGESQRAYKMLEGCATNEGDFTTATNAQSLLDAFDAIGDTIVSEVIRLKS